MDGTGRSERIRTSDPLLPKQVRYQAALRSDTVRFIDETGRLRKRIQWPLPDGKRKSARSVFDRLSQLFKGAACRLQLRESICKFAMRLCWGFKAESASLTRPNMLLGTLYGKAFLI